MSFVIHDLSSPNTKPPPASTFQVSRIENGWLLHVVRGMAPGEVIFFEDADQLTKQLFALMSEKEASLVEPTEPKEQS